MDKTIVFIKKILRKPKTNEEKKIISPSKKEHRSTLRWEIPRTSCLIKHPNKGKPTTRTKKKLNIKKHIPIVAIPVRNGYNPLID